MPGHERTSAPGAAGQPELTVVFLAYQQEAFVAEAVRSVLAQAGVVAEIILSDDASSDGTFRAMSAAVAGYRGPHQVVLRRNKVNQGIDHIVQLVDLANCDAMVMAHGDDISEPNRCRRLLDEMQRTGADVVSSNYLEIDTAGRPMGLNTDGDPTDGYTAEEIAISGWRRGMFGATLAWRRAVYTQFPRLDAQYLPIGHDTLVPFRGALLGGMRYVNEPLLHYRRHTGQWQHVLHDHRARETWEESQYSAAIMPRLAMARDLEHLLSQDTLPTAERQRLEALHSMVRENILALAAEWVQVRQGLYRQGWRSTWVSRQEFAKTGRIHGLGVLREAARNSFRRWRWQLFHL